MGHDIAKVRRHIRAGGLLQWVRRVTSCVRNDAGYVSDDHLQAIADDLAVATEIVSRERMRRMAARHQDEQK